MPAAITDKRARVTAALTALTRPTIAQLCEHARLSPSSVRRTLRAMERDGALQTHAVQGQAPVYVVLG